ncbi:MAG: hypothetical protein RMX96_26295 [Nostoc sp. ChiSLP02]|nr:hypothetical protein [Nostoc sp. ChiSLP02]
MKKKSVNFTVESQAYRNWVSSENDIYDEVFFDPLRLLPDLRINPAETRKILENNKIT